MLNSHRQVLHMIEQGQLQWENVQARDSMRSKQLQRAEKAALAPKPVYRPVYIVQVCVSWMTSAGFVLVKATPTHVLGLYCDLDLYRLRTLNMEPGMNVEAIGLLTNSAIHCICLSILPRHKIWTMGHMGQVCLRFLLCKKANIPLTNPYDPCGLRF